MDKELSLEENEYEDDWGDPICFSCGFSYCPCCDCDCLLEDDEFHEYLTE